MAGSILPHGLYPGRDHVRILLVGLLTLGIFIVNVFGFVFGITIVFPHLFYIPIILASYWYPRHGIAFAAVTAAVYLIVSSILTPPDLPTLSAAVCRAAVFIIVGGVVAYLSRSLREQEERYRGLFDHSQAGTLLVRMQESDFVIEEDNPRISDLLGGNGAPLTGSPLSRFWPEEGQRQGFLAALRKEGAVHDAEAELVKNGGQPIAALISGSLLSGDRAILTIEDITDRKRL